MAGSRGGVRRRVNWRLLLVVVLGVGALGGGLYGAREWRRNGRAARGLESGLEAYEANDWRGAASGLGTYLSRHEGENDIWYKYAVAQHGLWLEARRAGRRVRSHGEQAILAYRHVLREDPAHAKAAIRVSSLYPPGEAEMVLSQFLAAAPDNVEALMQRALARERLGRYKDAEADLRTIIDRVPTHVAAYVQLARLTREHEQVAGDPEAILREAVQRNLTSRAAHAALRGYLARWDTGSPEERKEKIAQADKAAEDALGTDPTNVPLALYVADIKRFRREFREAHAILDRLDSASPAVIVVKINLLMIEGKAAMALPLCDELVETQKNAASHLLRARVRAALRQFDKAREDYEAVTGLEPENPQAWMSLSRFCSDRGETEDAVRAVGRALEIDGTRPQTVLSAVGLYERHPDPEIRKKGEELLKRALEANPQDVGLLAFRAQRLINRRSRVAIEQAQEILDDVTRRSPTYVSAWALMAQARIFLDFPEAALDAVSGGLKALQVRPDETWRRKLLFRKAEAERLRWPTLAAATLRPLWEKDHGDLPAALALAGAYLAAKEPAKAIAMLEETRTEWDVMRVNMALADAYDRAGKADKALEAVQRAIDQALGNPNPMLQRVRLLARNGRLAEIKPVLDAWQEAHPRDRVTLMAAAEGLMRTAQELTAEPGAEDGNRVEAVYQTARQVAEMVIEKDPTDIRPQVTVAIICQTGGLTDEAEKRYHAVLAKQERHPIVLNNLAWLLCEDRKAYQDALILAERGRDAAPQFADIRDTLGVIYHRMRRFDEAAKAFEACIRLAAPAGGTEASARFHLARLLAEQGSRREAAEHLKDALAGPLPAKDRAEAEALQKKLTGA